MISLAYLRKALFTSAAAITLMLSACSGGGDGSAGENSSTGTVHVSMTDAPGCGYDQVNVTVVKVRVHQDANAGDSDSGWHDISLNPARKVDLMNLTNGVLEDLGQTSLPTGHYTQLRLLLASNADTPLANSVVQSGTNAEVALDTPSAVQSGIKLINGFDVAANTTADLVLDFDACKSIVAKGNGGFSLKPVITVIPKITSGSISGYVQTGMDHAIVSVQKNGVVIKSTIPESTNGSFKLSPVPADTNGDYAVVVTSNDHATAAITGVSVTAGSDTVISTQGAPISPASSSTHMISGTITPLGISAAVRATQTLTSGTKIEVGYLPADTGSGAYSFTLAYAVPQTGVFGALPITLTADNAAAGKFGLEASADGYTTQTANVDISVNTSLAMSFVLTK